MNPSPRRDGKGRLTANTDLVGGVLLALFGAVGLLQAQGGTYQVWIFPRVLSALLVVLGLGLLVKGLVAADRRGVLDRRAALVAVLPFVLGLLAYYFLLSRLGFLVTTVLFYGGGTLALRGRFGIRAVVVSFVWATVLALLLWQVFKGVFYIPLPTGSWLERWGWVQ